MLAHHAPPSARVAIITDEPGWHGARLADACAARGVGTVTLSLVQCHFDLTGGPTAVVLPGFAPHLPDGVLVRGVPGGSLEQVVLRLDVLHALRELAVPVYNDARAIERTVDKAMTSFLLERAGVPTPATWVTESPAQARAIVLREMAQGRAVVLKPLFGSQGDGLHLLQSESDLARLQEVVTDSAEAHYGGAFYLQAYLGGREAAWQDLRVLVIGGRARAAMVRRGEQWITNRARGGQCEPALLEPELAHLAQRAAQAVGADYAGVDLIRGQDGRLYVLEVNGIPAWQGLQQTCSVDLAQCLVDDFLERRLPRARLETVA